MPWKGEKDPYKIWLSEIILQQTRVAQGLDYYTRFIETFPTITALAAADEQEVFKLWEGLGYYSRCRNLIASARNIAFEHGGKFPDNYENILLLKGVGPYTAAAIASFAYNLPYAVTDGNVFRVLARFFGIEIPIDSHEAKKYFAALAQELLDTDSPAVYNQAIMDFGAVICKPRLPFCAECMLRPQCTAFKKNLIDHLPVKEKKLIKKKRFFFYIIAEYENNIYVRQRTNKDIWQGLWEFILVETPAQIPAEKFLQSPEFIFVAGKKHLIKEISAVSRQQLTHQSIEAVFIRIKLEKPLKNSEYMALPKRDLKKVAFPRLINSFLEKSPKN